MDEPHLAKDFPPAGLAEWRALAEGVLKGADFDNKLVSRSHDGLRIEPLYPKADPAPMLGRAAHAQWRIAQRVDHPDVAAANELARADLAGGADALSIVFAGAPSARGFGLDPTSPEALERALDGIMLDLIAVRLEAGAAGLRAAAMLLDLAGQRGHAPGDLSLDLGIDPIGVFAATGQTDQPWPEAAERLARDIAGFTRRGFVGRALSADGRPYHEAGASEAQELAGLLSTGLAYLRALEAGGIALEAARGTLSFLIAADANEFLTVARFRALRRLWARVEEACGLAPKPIVIHAETAWRMTTRRDPWVNILRGTLAAFSAGIGGADSVTVLPFTAALGLPDGFARRIARNTQSILLEESNLWRVADPTAGAGGFEAMTDALAREAWRLFQEIEREGGIVASLAAGGLQARIAAVREARATALATRREAITGTSEFPDISEASVAVLLPSPRSPASDVSDVCRQETKSGNPDLGGGAESRQRLGEGQSPVSGLEAPSHPDGASRRLDLCPQVVRGLPLPSLRLAEPYEALRDRSDAILAATGSRPKVFLANLGPIAEFSARAAFAKNFFEAGGIEALGNDGFASPDALAAAFTDSGARFACLCASDATYALKAMPVVVALQRAGAVRIWIAGRAGELAEPFASAGVDAYIHVGSNLLASLGEAYDGLEVLPNPS